MIAGREQTGFTLIELMIVVSIIGILASVALPAYQDYVVRSEMTEAISMASTGKVGVTEFYRDSVTFPADNYAAAIPAPEQLIANRISSVTVEDGAVHVVMGHKASAVINGKTLSFRPATVDGSPLSPMSWLCGYDEPIPGMTAVGDNKTDIDRKYLPSACRGPYTPPN